MDFSSLLESLRVSPVLALALFVLLLLIASVQLSTRVTHFYPSTLELCSLYGKLLVSPLYKTWRWKSKLRRDMRLDPNLAFKLPFAADPMNVQQYVQMCGLQGKVEAEDLPFAYVASSFLYPTVCLLSQRRYLFPVLGGIHVHNYFRWEPLKMQQKYEGLLKVQETVKFTRKGAEVTFPQVLLNEQGREVWRSTTTVLVPCRNPPQDPSTSIGAEAVPTKRMGLVDECRSQGLKVVLVRERAFKTAADTGRRFAAVVKDYNPIHLFTWSARLFGFRRAICHGMYVGALALEEALDAWRAEGGEATTVMEADVKFIRPCFVGNGFVVKIWRVEDKAAEAGKRLVVMVAQQGKEDTVHMQATVQAAREERR